jgi:hypothetical protein
LENTQTDRIYLANDSGFLVCLREVGNINPYIHGDEAGMESGSDKTAAGEPKPDSKPKMIDPNDPFGNALPDSSQPSAADKSAADPNDPFGGGNDQPAGGDKPEGGEDKPGGGNPDDPFGGG